MKRRDKYGLIISAIIIVIAVIGITYYFLNKENNAANATVANIDGKELEISYCITCSNGHDVFEYDGKKAQICDFYTGDVRYSDIETITSMSADNDYIYYFAKDYDEAVDYLYKIKISDGSKERILLGNDIQGIKTCTINNNVLICVKQNNVEQIRSVEPSDKLIEDIQLIYAYEDGEGNIFENSDCIIYGMDKRIDCIVNKKDNSTIRINAIERMPFYAYIDNKLYEFNKTEYFEYGKVDKEKVIDVNSGFYSGFTVFENEYAYTLLNINDDKGNSKSPAPNSFTPYSGDTIKNQLLKLNVITGDKEIVYDTKDKSVNIIGYFNGEIYLYKNIDKSIYRHQLVSGKEDKIMDLPDMKKDLNVEWYKDTLKCTYKDTNGKCCIKVNTFTPL